MCLKRSAHGLVPNHPVFQGPFPVDIEMTTAPTPDNYRKYLDGVDLPDELPVWNVDTTDYTLVDDLQPGTVANGWGFEDSPDAEVIARGINSKGPSAVALGRHGSLFLWGFACEPGRMTPSGRHAFLNAICYIQQFDHAARLVDRVESHRNWALQRVHEDADKLAALRADVEYLRAEGRSHVVDEDCKALGLSNRDVALLDRCVTALENGEDTERCLRLLRRYTGLEHGDAAAWRTWLEAARPHLFFSDIGGFRFFTDDRTPAADDAERDDADPLGGDPVALSASVEPASTAPGGVVTLSVRLRHAPGWHSYAEVPQNSAYVSTRLAEALPEGWRPVGRWSTPASVPMPDEPGVQMVEGDAVYRLRVRLPADARPGEHELGVRVGYMTCDAYTCEPATTVALRATVRCAPR